MTDHTETFPMDYIDPEELERLHEENDPGPVTKCGLCYGAPHPGQKCPPAPCEYSAMHLAQGVPADGSIDCGPVGIVPACQKCIDFYASL